MAAEGQAEREIFFIKDSEEVVLRYLDEDNMYHYFYEGQGGSGVIPSGIQEHMDDTTIHFVESDIDHLNIKNRGVYTHAEIDDFILNGGSGGSGVVPSGISEHMEDVTIHFTEDSISHNNISDTGTNTHAQIDTFITNSPDPTTVSTHISDSTVHFTKSSISHTEISDIGTNTHAQIDAFIAGGGGNIGYGDTASRPASPYNGEPYFDTDLGYQINYNGTNWVNSTGAIV